MAILEMVIRRHELNVAWVACYSRIVRNIIRVVALITGEASSPAHATPSRLAQFIYV